MDEHGDDEAHFAVVLWCDLSLDTGYSINERESTIALLEAFHEHVHVICPRPAVPDEFADERIEYVYNHRRHHPLHYLGFVAGVRSKIRELNQRVGLSAVVFRIGPFPLEAALTARHETAVILKGFRGFEPVVPQRRPWLRRLSGPGTERLYRYVARRCVGADVESGPYAEWLSANFPIPMERMTIMPNGANTGKFAPEDRGAARQRYGWDRFRHVVGYVGAIDELRCARDLIEAAVAMRNMPDVGFVIVGRGPLVPELQARVAREGLGERVLFPGFMPYQEIPAVMNTFDVALDLTKVPFTIGRRTVYGSYSQKIAQYLACGAPVLAWRTPDTVFLDQENVGRTVPVGEGSRIPGVLREMVPQGERDSYRAKVRAFACRELGADAIARKRMDFWRSLVNGRV